MSTPPGIVRGVALPATGLANPYDAVPYAVSAYPQTRPDRSGALAALFGLETPPPRRCRVLELGCASGGNLIPLALTSPDSSFVGIDLSARQIADGRAVVDEIGLANVELKQVSILDVGADFGTFDYILAHGVYSWVPAEVQDKLLDICRGHLATNGIAYVSYNTFPGWHARGAIREMLWYHTERFTDAAARLREGRGLLQFLAATVQQGSDYGVLLRKELDELAHTSDSYFLHEHLEDVNLPVYFHEFARRAAARGLQYLGEADAGMMLACRFGDEAEKTLRRISPDLLHLEQYMDFLCHRTFRQTLLCHDRVALDRRLRPEAVQTFYLAGDLKPVSANPEVRSDKPEEFRCGAEKTMVAQDPLLKAALMHLSRMWPLPVYFPEMVRAARAQLDTLTVTEPVQTLTNRLLNAYFAGLVEFSLAEPAFRIDVSARPVASAYARQRARNGGEVTNLRLENVSMGEPSRLVLQQLDGTHDRAYLIDLVAEWLDKKAVNVAPGAPSGPSDPTKVKDRAGRYIDQALDGFARSALLTG